MRIKLTSWVWANACLCSSGMDISSPSSSQGFIRPTARPNQLIDDSISGPESTLGAIGLYFDAGRPEEVEIDADAVILDIKFLLRDWLGGGEGIFLSTSDSVWALGRTAGESLKTWDDPVSESASERYYALSVSSNQSRMVKSFSIDADAMILRFGWVLEGNESVKMEIARLLSYRHSQNHV